MMDATLMALHEPNTRCVFALWWRGGGEGGRGECLADCLTVME